MADKNNEKNERIRRLKGKLQGLNGLERLREYVRYDRARSGDLAHAMPKEYVEDMADALRSLVAEKYGNDRKKIDRMVELMKKQPSKPFV